MQRLGDWLSRLKRAVTRRTALACFVSLVLVAAQTAILAHASSPEAQAPDHDTKTCVLHVNGDRPASALAPDIVQVTAPVFCPSRGVVFEGRAPDLFRLALIQARGPPSQS